jgi:hypothetical protein
MAIFRNLFAVAVLLSSSLAVADAQKAVETKAKGKGYALSYSYPAVISKMPKLKARLEADKKEQLAEVKTWAKDWAKDDPSASQTMEIQVDWQTVTNLPGYLSLTHDIWHYSGGAHGNFGRASEIWDKKAAVSIMPVTMFSSAAEFDKIIQTQFCDLLDIERSKKRDGEKVDRSKTDDWMQACPAPSELTVILGSSDGKAFNRMAVYAAPYAVGPYAEGDYEIGLPITARLMAIVKPEYRAVFAVTPK